MDKRQDNFVGVPINKRPGYQAKNFAGGNTQSPAEAADQHARLGKGHQQKYAGIDHDRNTIVSQTIFEPEPGQGELGFLEPHQVLSGSGFNVDPRTVQKEDPAAFAGGAFSRGIHPNQDPMNPGPRMPPLNPDEFGA